MHTILRPTNFVATLATCGLLHPIGIPPNSPSNLLLSMVEMNDVASVATLLMCAYALITCKICSHVIWHNLEYLMWIAVYGPYIIDEE